jgi:hypothetical protein
VIYYQGEKCFVAGMNRLGGVDLIKREFECSLSKMLKMLMSGGHGVHIVVYPQFKFGEPLFRLNIGRLQVIVHRILHQGPLIQGIFATILRFQLGFSLWHIAVQ